LRFLGLDASALSLAFILQSLLFGESGCLDICTNLIVDLLSPGSQQFLALGKTHSMRQEKVWIPVPGNPAAGIGLNARTLQR
jgi:hypothetical protein